MFDYFLRAVFLISLILNGAILSGIIGKFFLQDKIGFDAVAGLLGWLMAGAVVALIIGVLVISKFSGQQLRVWIIGLLLLLLVWVGWFFVQKSRAAQNSEQLALRQTSAERLRVNQSPCQKKRLTA